MNLYYVHGYDSRESVRLHDQAGTLVELLHADTAFSPGSRVLEAGCGVGAQTVTLAARSPHAKIFALEISETSLEQACQKVTKAEFNNVCFQQGDIFDLPFGTHSFDHVFVCFVLEHLPNPLEALQYLKYVIKPGGSITVIEGDHGSAYFYPDSETARQVIACQITLQAQTGGNALIGRQLYPLLTQAGFQNCRISPRMVYVDDSHPELVEGFTKNTFTAMIEGVRQSALQAGLISGPAFDQGIQDLYRTSEADGVFCYTFFKATAEISIS